ncbi:FCD domain-containing protein [Microvirga tunisiensis]|uniref:FCD domain-containing protein n=1 Tax=Pannonibacter tanglangensis TaxID=2750084 RepID=A0A7X5JA20_9HYPH|nr:FCD domain-containing protein [Pannonibacter sp. XCT-53]
MEACKGRTDRVAAGSQQETGSRAALDALIALIEARGLGVGDRLPPELDLAAALGCGRSTIREILKSWENLGLVSRNKGAGTRITAEISNQSLLLPVTVKIEADSLYRTLEVRRPLEIEAARLACLRGTDEDRRHIAQRANELLADYHAGLDWRPADHRFHAAIHAASHNPLFAQIIRQVHKAFDTLYEAPFGRPHLGQSSIPIHRDLADAVIAGDAAKAEEIMAAILDITHEEARRVVEDGQ